MRQPPRACGRCRGRLAAAKYRAALAVVGGQPATLAAGHARLRAARRHPVADAANLRPAHAGRVSLHARRQPGHERPDTGFFVLAGPAGPSARSCAARAACWRWSTGVFPSSNWPRPRWREQVRRQAANDGSRTWRILVRRAYAVQLGAAGARGRRRPAPARRSTRRSLDEIAAAHLRHVDLQRVLFDVRNPLFLFVAAFLLIEIFLRGGRNASSSSALWDRAARPPRGPHALCAGSLRPRAQPAASAHLCAPYCRGAGWLMWVVAVPSWSERSILPGLRWRRRSWLCRPPDVRSRFHVLALFVVRSLLAAVHSWPLLLFGIVSAVRAALWTVAGLR